MLIIFILVLFGSLVYVYFTYEKPAESVSLHYSNITIGTYYLTDSVRTGYMVFVNGVLYTQGITSGDGSVTLATVPSNSTIQIENYNLENQIYYTSLSDTTYVYGGQVYRFNLNLNKPDILHIENKTGITPSNTNFILEISSNGYNNPIFCMTWTGDFVSVTTNMTQIIPMPPQFSNYYNCYQTNQNLDNSSIDINVQYNQWGPFNKNDYIFFTFNDQDYSLNGTKIFPNQYNFTVSPSSF